MANVFEDNDNEEIDVVVHRNGERKVIGKAKMTTEEDGSLSMVMQVDDPETEEFLKPDVSGYSIDTSGPMPKRREEPTSSGRLTRHDHKVTDHQDGMSKWCDVCGLTAGYLKPQNRHIS